MSNKARNYKFIDKEWVGGFPIDVAEKTFRRKGLSEEEITISLNKLAGIKTEDSAIFKGYYTIEYK